ncbi:diguanylate cyclase/phosphodiesterase (GGDEF & EAL domain) with PAS/PAC sensor(s) [Candidatus Burkholderia verschuerenii]|uniref:Diguanylate cyclase/phosphodiesterase (GGDEF & EAL domain) with PAS/PAC sensor(S) n=1 Tax=Candidatus Burkholderia verschuerenii TaxID=242163 RepID=A0A0L0MES8_9BURK|nr:GGDEF domain-containing protein [Candidatus Burkholderia verschuerenii]KND60780.1 diguanylate cyclase/phosphodiesterase (GGDEF & EAL domain) with PAS/PAC sensor(s) [Candidatus Burkholderia verschuerenii]
MEQAYQPARRTHGFAWAGNRHPEREQAMLRVGMGVAVLLAFGAYAWLVPSQASVAVTRLIAAYVCYGALTLFVVNRSASASASKARLVVTTVADQGFVGVALAIGGTAALPLLWAMFWFLIGSGCRYGKRTLALSCATAFAAVVTLALWQPWWHANRPAAIGLALSVLAASAYLSVLVDRLGDANRDLARQASTDPLTGLSNRYALKRVVDLTMTGDAIAGADSTALLLIYLDGFKEVNDTYGHAAGDLLLQAFAQLLARNMRRADTVARLGGDEFVVLARGVRDRRAVLSVADGIHAILAAITSVQERPVLVSASIGACELSGAMQTRRPDVSIVLRAADRAMYRAKRLGQGKTVFAEAKDFDIA